MHKMLMPKRTKYRKQHRQSYEGKAKGNIKLNFGEFGLMATEGTYITVGNKKIDFGDKKISSGDKDLMNLTAITIDGDENIDIVPKADEEIQKNNNIVNDDISSSSL